MAKIATTGAAGFIGFHAAKKFKSEGHEVIGFDNFNDYYDPTLKHDRSKILKEAGIFIDRGDLMDTVFLEEFMHGHKPDIVLHLAAYAGVRHSLKEPDKYIQNNVVGTHNLIDACHEACVDKIVYASTSCVMAGNELPWKEDEKLGYQLNPYGYTKATNESQFMAGPLPVAVGLRFFTVYGPWGRPDMALYDFTKNILKDNPIDLFNYGDMIRDFTYVDDIVNGINIIINEGLNKKEYKEIYNIGRGEQVQLVDFVEHIEKNLGRKAEKNLVPKHPADTKETWSDTTKLQKLGYNPKVSIAEGVEKFISWYKSYYKVN